ncbi:type I restriction-modification system [Vibrio ishigakensis]|uniref:Type I restriction-modification system n=1 Tax=Vibrio ishigakensis TaxID=1481914 RepID=A0A0B8QAM3_9VIBR|nr:type I restriction-modification system [Vibrio ishigakensis]
MSRVGQKERVTQTRLRKFFVEQLDYDYLGDWEYREGNRNIETGLLTDWLAKRGVAEALIKRTLRKLDVAAALGEGKKALRCE